MVTTTTQTDKIYISIIGYFAIAASIYTHALAFASMSLILFS